MVENYNELLKKRNLTPLHIVFTSLMAELSNFGILNQGTTNIVGSGIGKKIARCLKDMQIKIPNSDDELIKFLIKFCDICDNFIIKEENSLITVRIKIDKCKYCPKQIGEAEIKGTACRLKLLSFHRHL